MREVIAKFIWPWKRCKTCKGAGEVDAEAAAGFYYALCPCCAGTGRRTPHSRKDCGRQAGIVLNCNGEK